MKKFIGKIVKKLIKFFMRKYIEDIYKKTFDEPISDVKFSAIFDPTRRNWSLFGETRKTIICQEVDSDYLLTKIKSLSTQHANAWFKFE